MKHRHKHKYIIDGGVAECVLCGHKRKATKAQVAKAARIKAAMETRFARAIAAWARAREEEV